MHTWMIYMINAYYCKSCRVLASQALVHRFLSLEEVYFSCEHCACSVVHSNENFSHFILDFTFSLPY